MKQCNEIEHMFILYDNKDYMVYSPCICQEVLCV